MGSSTPTVAYLGSLTPEKNIGSAIRAVGRIPEACLLVIGDGGERDQLQMLAGQVAPGRVLFLGQLSEPAAILASADVLILPSRTEGIPGVLIEAGFLGLPIVATAVGGVREIVDDGITGSLVPPGDELALTTALRKTLADPGAVDEQARRHYLERFEISRVAASWDALLQELGA
jgi:glycosyltransferase involved in cell wall biosynthesis